ncbi:MAG: hypothetical protein MJ100_02065 [Ruminococcus sp.]|nr:hypothetical protein [Ruminococcus sp.]
MKKEYKPYSLIEVFKKCKNPFFKKSMPRDEKITKIFLFSIIVYPLVFAFWICYVIGYTIWWGISCLLSKKEESNSLEDDDNGNIDEAIQ